MHIVIPTIGRNEKLIKVIGSVDYEATISIMYDHNYKGSVYTRNKMLQNINDNILYATDDMIFQPGAIQRAYEDLLYQFQDTDGVIGLTQLTPHHPSGVALVGYKFLKRYPANQLFNPKYHHFAAQEVFDYANKLKKFKKSKATIIHNQDFMDYTAKMARKYKEEDQDLYRKRQELGHVWPEK